MCVCGRRLDGCAVVGLQQEDPLQPIYRKVAGDMFRAVNNIDVPKTVPLVLSYTCIMLAMYVARMDAMQAHALVGHVKVVDAYDTTAGCALRAARMRSLSQGRVGTGGRGRRSMTASSTAHKGPLSAVPFVVLVRASLL